MPRFDLRVAPRLLGMAVLYVLSVAEGWPLVTAALAGGPRDDEAVYHAQAEQLLAGRGFVEVGEWPDRLGLPTAHRHPGTPALLAAVYGAIGGADPARGRLALWLLSAASAPLAFALAWRLWRSRAAAWAAGLLIILLHAPALQGARMLGEAPAAVLLLGGLALGLTPRPLHAVAAGLLVGGAVLCRVFLAPVVFVLPLWWLLRGARALAFAAALGAVALPLAWSARNQAVIGTFALSTQTISVWQGVSPFTDGRWPGAWTRDHPQYAYFLERVPDFDSLDEAQRSRAFVEQAAREVSADPGRALTLIPLKLRAWASPRTSLGVDWIWLVVLPLSLVGALRLLRRRELGALVLLGAPIATTAWAAIVTFGDARFRHPADAMFCILAASLVMARRAAPPTRIELFSDPS